jgi:hypothetical protein
VKTDLSIYNDRTGSMTVDTLTFTVRVLEARNRYGHLDFRVTPISGDGERWVEQHRVALQPELTTTTVEISDTLIHEIKAPANARVMSLDHF